MLLYISLASDRLEETQEKALKNNLSAIQAQFNHYVEQQNAGLVTLINDCESDNCDNWQLGIEQPIKKNKQLQIPIDFFNTLAKDFKLDFELGMIENATREAVCYFGFEEGAGDAFMIARYLDL